MIRSSRSNRPGHGRHVSNTRPNPSPWTPRMLLGLALLAVLALLAACGPTVGALGTPATPEPTPVESVPLASGDATPDLSSPSVDEVPTDDPTIGPSTGPSAIPASTGSPAASPSPAATPRPTPRPTAAPVGTSIVRAYFVMGSFTGNEGLVPVLREVPQTKGVATAAMRALLKGPNDAEMAGRPAIYTAIPDDTTLLGLSIKDGVATVNLSKEFESGGGSASALARLAQVTYTLTQFPTVDKVLFQLDGEPVTVFGAEGVVLDHPVGRADFHDQLPAIFVDRPAWGANLGNPGIVSGLANVFEATFMVELRDARDVTVARRQVMASCGTGCWGTFRTSLPYTVSKGQWGTLRVYDKSAKDGSVENLTEYLVWLAPAG
jgi:germination protein M